MSDTPDDEREPLPVNPERRVGSRGARPREPGRPASRAEPTERTSARRRIGIRELRQHASVYVDLAEKGYTVDITNRGRLVAQLVPVFEAAEEPGGVADLDPYPSPASGRPTASRLLGRTEQGQGQAGQGQAEKRR